MQFSVVGSPSTWDRYGVDGNHDGRTSAYDPADAIPAAARYLRAVRRARPTTTRALFAYNHADWYVAEVLAKADEYRGAATGAGDDARRARRGDRRASVLAQPADHRSRRSSAPTSAPAASTRACSPTLAWIGARHTVVITALRSDHSTYTVDGTVSNHAAGRAMDIGAVDGEICRGTRTGRCADLVRELAAVTGPLRSTELIYCWDPDGPPTRAASPAPTTATTSMWGGTDERRETPGVRSGRRPAAERVSRRYGSSGVDARARHPWSLCRGRLPPCSCRRARLCRWCAGRWATSTAALCPPRCPSVLALR